MFAWQVACHRHFNMELPTNVRIPSFKPRQMKSSVLRRRRSRWMQRVPADHPNGAADYQPSRGSLGDGRESGALSDQGRSQGDDADEVGKAAVKSSAKRRNDGVVPFPALITDRQVLCTRQAQRSQSQPPVGIRPHFDYAPMSRQYGKSVDDLESELEARGRRRRSLYYESQRAVVPSQSLPRIPPQPTRRELVSRNEFWEALDDDTSPPTTSTGQSETPSRLQRMRAKLPKWQVLRGKFRF